MDKHKRRNILIVSIIAVLGFAAWMMSGEKPIPVVVHTLDKGLVEWTVANTRAGTIEACRRAHLAPTIGGQIASLNIEKGDRVEKNQILAELWNSDLRAQVTLAKRQANAARQAAEESCLMADVAERDAQRLQKLEKDKLTTEEDIDRAVTNARARRAGCHAAHSNADVSEAQVEVAEATLERTRVRAPFDGRVAEINGELGEFVTPSPQGIQTLPVVDLMDTSCLYISAPIDEVDAPHIQLGMVARISLDAFPDTAFLGAVRRIAPYVLELEKQARTVDVEAVFMDEKQYANLIPGYSADMEIIIDERHDTLRVPTEAILEGDRVYVLNDGVIEERQITKGLANWQYTEALKGVSAGEQVVLSVDKAGVKPGIAAIEDTSATDL